jgi:hypothetical protein
VERQKWQGGYENYANLKTAKSRDENENVNEIENAQPNEKGENENERGNGNKIVDETENANDEIE